MRHVAISRLISAVGLVASLGLVAVPAFAQVAPMTNQARQALDFYGGRSAIRTLNEMPQRTPILPSTTGQISYNGKPFQAASGGQTVSPYLNLFRDDERHTESVPNYFTSVRPQLEQQSALEQQQRELLNMQRQAQANAQNRSAAIPGAGTQARYMDTAQFYGGWQR
jgi:hypothetical protein